ncbi:unnamed protein product, partial [Mesorhabditis belari]|uniref:Zinc metalloproteinase n=1 Tax=Mesorhabditis belari TaxID=2138241 RepID=A0AAF3F1C5_9BILA
MLLRAGVALILLGCCLAQGWGKRGNNNSTRSPRGKGSRKHNWGDKMNEQQIGAFRKSLSHTNVDRFHAALDKMRERAAERIEPNEQEKAGMYERMKQMRPHTRTPRVRPDGDTLTEVNEKQGVSQNLYGGDMALDDPQVDVILGDFVEDDDSTDDDVAARKKRQAYRNSRYPANLWGSGSASPMVYYYFDGLTANAQKMAQLAIDFWQNSTCITFVKSTTNSNRIRFFTGQGCYSYVGMIGGTQDLSLGTGCDSFGTAAHEIGHALGFFHEQSRLDRDNAITVNFNNIPSDWVDQFDKETTSTNFNYGMPYDYGSVMQYGASSASSNRQATMVSKVPVYQDTMGSDKVSFYDISMMNDHYKCKAKCTSGATCVNGGFRNSKNCNSCICPEGWGGATCAERASGCGAALTATSTLQQASITVGSGQQTVQPTWAKCHHMITAPAGNKIEITLNTLQYQQCQEGCIYTGIEVKASLDHRLTGIRYCCSDDVGQKIISEGNIVPIITYNRYYQSTFTFSYRLVPSSTASTIQLAQFPSAGATYSTSTNPNTNGGGTGGGGTTVTCTDDANCVTWASNGFCTSSTYTAAQKKQYCPNKCNMCS